MVVLENFIFYYTKFCLLPFFFVTIFRLEQLDDEEQQIILTKFRGAETDSVREQNEFLMMLLRAHCEMKQGRHIHDTAENR